MVPTCSATHAKQNVHPWCREMFVEVGGGWWIGEDSLESSAVSPAAVFPCVSGRLFNALPEDLELDMKSTSGRERHDREYYALPQFYNGTLGRNMSEVVQWDTYPYDT